jgi:hypothetical protein
VGIGIFGDFSFGIIFQQVTQRLVTHCAGGFLVGVVLNVIIIKVMLDRNFTNLEWNNENKVYFGDSVFDGICWCSKGRYFGK